ncbi:Vesicle transport v-SNARE protein superfamily [Taphrina deformans PYCC 5710]|uniref:Vesicle transport v-SNARE protein superfamily n=1 Tax=Taphrina deformans (strain PYCC 5710 / ATCC 11124 / CBS 356.35 / IMI 108563 / JCM 9778 / NBRC 8474) TaxID=1097556 RepID=R4XH23_TAPDE|nr:Vesicle transport v-SNARE protein superfamily [Taphrina deformans PYCC 5710]|eukprot:CCG82676.1 Vesicle transport v-SNARE protein superfamily [Taphrina deformans PYCC 5710]
MAKTWGTLRAEQRLLEHQTETLLSSASPAREELDSILAQRRTVLEDLARVLEEQVSPGNKLQHLNRHREIQQEHEEAASRVLQKSKEQKDRENLLGDVNEDIKKWKGNAAGEEAYMLDERARIESSHTMADSVLAQAYATRDEFNLQKLSLQNIGQRISASSQKIPGMNTLLNKINTRQKRNSVILGTNPWLR